MVRGLRIYTYWQKTMCVLVGGGRRMGFEVYGEVKSEVRERSSRVFFTFSWGSREKRLERCIFACATSAEHNQSAWCKICVAGKYTVLGL